MSFTLLKTLWQRRLVRAGLGILVLAVAAFALYKLAHVPQPVDLAATGKFSPASIKLGEQELIIEGPVVNQDERLVVSCDSGPKGSVEVRFDKARLDQQTIEAFAGLDVKLPDTWAKIIYQADRSRNSDEDAEPCATRIELRVDSQAPSEIRISQLSEPGLNRWRSLQVTSSDVEFVANMLTEPSDSYLAPGCQKLLSVGKVSHSTSINLTARVAVNSTVHFTVYPLNPDSTPWSDAQGSLALGLGGPPRLNPTDAPPFQAKAISVRRFDSGTGTQAPAVLNARSEADGPLLTVSNLKIFSDHLEVSVSGKGHVEIDGVKQTTDFLKLMQENFIISGLLIAANAALLAWVARLVFKAPPTPRPGK